ncbi:hypothetical protein M408DRAFT_313880 [Serendipita vermifera MAFF 305830]|uniref:Uncharacterized protein n=1 Tax=Serendipita vermifera MAFF 305830 TaxID=933852 RepID=A0A0C2XAG4_SERVB|nr:hypothetical protein M408DRAFT_313880 [Serendipita vermifera MAFF 305830]
MLRSRESEVGFNLEIHKDHRENVQARARVGTNISLRELIGPYVDFWALILGKRWFERSHGMLWLTKPIATELEPGSSHEWDIYTMLDLSQEADKRAYRQDRILSYPEAILVDCFPFSTNSACELPVSFKAAKWGVVWQSTGITGRRCWLGRIIDFGPHPWQEVVWFASRAVGPRSEAAKSSSDPQLELQLSSLCKSMGVAGLLEEARTIVTEIEKGHAALLGRFVADEEAGSSKREGYSVSITRSCSSRARGEAGDAERQGTLKNAKDGVWSLHKSNQMDGIFVRRNIPLGLCQLKREHPSCTPQMLSRTKAGLRSALSKLKKQYKVAEGGVSTSWEQFCFDKAMNAVLETLSKPQEGDHWGKRTSGGEKETVPGFGLRQEIQLHTM